MKIKTFHFTQSLFIFPHSLPNQEKYAINKMLFMKAKVECGTAVWTDDIDIAPEHLYECSVPYIIKV